MGKQGTAAPVRVLIADYEPDVRQALRLVCEETLALTVVAEASDCHELLTLFRIIQPDILLLEWELPGMQPSALMQILRARGACVMSDNMMSAIIVLGGRPEMRSEALGAQADGFVYKGDPPDELIHLLRTLIET